MTRTLKFLLISLGLFLILNLGYSVLKITHNIHKKDLSGFSKFSGFFNDSAKKNLNSDFYIGLKSKNDELHKYFLNEYRIYIWQFQNIEKYDFSKLATIRVSDEDGGSFKKYESLNLGERPEIGLKLGYCFNGSVILHLDNQSKIEQEIKTETFAGYYGSFNTITLSDDQMIPQIVFDFSHGSGYSMVLLCHYNNDLLFLLIESASPFSEEILKQFKFY